MDKNNYCIIMAGGTGSRFWPMSTVEHPKQFIDIFGNGESLLQSTFRRFEQVCPRENIIIVTNNIYRGLAEQQIGGLRDYQVIYEPMRRNTAPCVAYAAAIIRRLNPQANIIVSPSDHAIFDNDEFTRTILESLRVVQTHDWIITLGIKPLNPNTKYGYIQYNENNVLEGNNKLHEVITYTEKPPYDMAVQFLNSGDFLWNAGIFIWSLPTLEKAYRRYLPDVAAILDTVDLDTPYEDVEKIYSTCQPISADYGIMEKADNVHVIEADFRWSDVETWQSLYESVEKDENRNVVVGDNVFTYDVKNCIINLPSSKTVVLQGLEDYIVAGDEETVLVCKRSEEHRVFKFESDIEVRKNKQEK